MAFKPIVCVAALNWGLGHAGRCIPIINELLLQQCEVIILGNGHSLDLLREHFPHLKIENLPNFQIKYSKHAILTQMKIIAQIPFFWQNIKNDLKITAQIVNKYKPHILISDNRYGFYNSNTYNIFITHQICPILPTYLRFFSVFFERILLFWMNRFDEIWIPDVENGPNLSGKLSHKNLLLTKKRFVGILSRFLPFQKANCNSDSNNIVVIASGPEPSCSQLINIVANVARNSIYPFILLVPPFISIKKQHHTAFKYIVKTTSKDVINNLLTQSLCVLSRSSYTTLMDLVRLNKKALLIPTPGQTEQIYLAKHLKNYHLFEIFNPARDCIDKKISVLMQKKQKQQIQSDDKLLKQAIENLLKKFKN